VFNLGIGMVLVVSEGEAFKTLDILRSEGHQAVVIGSVERGDQQVRLR
jgi:phosphoribosylformylglycinamidine cyclo-ligase